MSTRGWAGEGQERTHEVGTNNMFPFPTAGTQHPAQPVRAALWLRLDQHPPGLHSGEKRSPHSCACHKGTPTGTHPYPSYTRTMLVLRLLAPLAHTYTRSLCWLSCMQNPAAHAQPSPTSVIQAQPPQQKHTYTQGNYLPRCVPRGCTANPKTCGSNTAELRAACQQACSSTQGSCDALMPCA